MTNCHIHIFKEKDIPRKFLPLGLVRLLAKPKIFRIIAKILNNLKALHCRAFSKKHSKEHYDCL